MTPYEWHVFMSGAIAGVMVSVDLGFICWVIYKARKEGHDG